MPEHWLHLYQRPKQGNVYLGRWKAQHYRHTISAVGWYDTAQCDLALPRTAAEKFIEDHIGCRVAVYVDNPTEPIWDGYINRISFNAGGLLFTRSLDEMMNRVAVTYSDPSVGAGPQITATVNDTSSQALYGIKEGSIEGKVLLGATVTKMTALRDTFLNVRAQPQNSTTFNAQGSETTLSLELMGWYQTLNWAKYIETTATNRNASQMFTQLLPNYPNSSFFDTSDTSEIGSNTSWSQDQRDMTGRTYFQMWQSVQEAGDGAAKWIFGVSPTDANGSRRVYYRQANATVDYHVLARDGRVRNLYGRPVRPWAVRPDRGVRIMDILTGWSSSELDDPREFYIDRVEYDADAQSAQLVGPDDQTAEGVFQMRNFYETNGRRFSFKGRVDWTS